LSVLTLDGRPNEVTNEVVVADQEWIDQYYEERREQEAKLEMLGRRLAGRIAVESW
jgi:hypothetical protein